MSAQPGLNVAALAGLAQQAPHPPPAPLLVPAAAAAVVPEAPSPNNNNNAVANLKSRNRSWDENYAQLLTYKATHGGSTDVPLTYKADRILGKWVAHLREHQNQAALSQERKNALNAIGFIWNPHEQKWNEMYERLKEYKAKTGHCKVPTNWKADRKLGKWVMRQREKRKNNLLPEERLRKLEDIGFVWAIYAEAKGRKSNIIDQKWNSRFEELKEYQQLHNHCNVPKDYGPLGKWVQEQRVMHQRKLLKQERKKVLEEIGFIFSYRAQKCQQDWNQMYECLKACSTTTEDGQFKVLGMDVGLNRWVHRQKEAYRTHRLDPGREVLLNKINFQFPERGPVPVKGVNPPINGADNSPSRNSSKTLDLLASSEDDKLIGIQLAQGIEVVSKFMAISPAEFSKRLATVAPPKPDKKDGGGGDDNNATATKEKDSEKAKSAKKPSQLPIEHPPPEEPAEASKTDTDTDDNKPSPEINAFGRLLPKIVAMKEYGEETMEEGTRYLEGFVRQEKGWDPRPTDGDVYNRLLSLAAELGVLLNPESPRCQSVITSAELQLERVMMRKVKEIQAANEAAAAMEKKRKAEEGGDGDDDGEQEEKEKAEQGGEEEKEGEAPAAKRAKVGEEDGETRPRNRDALILRCGDDFVYYSTYFHGKNFYYILLAIMGLFIS